MSDSSDTTVSPVIHKGKRKAAILTTDSSIQSDSSSSSSDLEVTVVRRSGKRKVRIHESEDSESDSSIDKLHKIKRVPRIRNESDDSSSSSSSDDDESLIIRKRRTARRVVLSDDDDDDDNNDDNNNDGVNDNSNESESDSNISGVTDNGFQDNNTSDEWESDWISESEIDPTYYEIINKKESTTAAIASASVSATSSSNIQNVGNLSDSSDGETEKCPICLLSFNKQEVGTPETCDHSFCAECIQEWSKNVNTCPVDRQTFTLILVRKRFNGKVIRRVAVDVRRPSVDELIQEDPTYCEICGMSDREDRLLLCDGCDLGYHLECLDPPMDTVPVEQWFCSICHSPTVQHNDQQHQQSRRTRNEPRLLPRTSQSERIRATIEINRHNFSNFNTDQQSVSSSGFEDAAMPGTSQSTTSNSGTSSSTIITTSNRSRRNNSSTVFRKNRKSTKRRKKKTKKTRARYSITYEICDATGEKIAIKTKLKSTKRKRKYRKKKRSTRRTLKPKTVKKRLAYQLGMCPPKKAGLAVPEVKVKSNTSNIGNIGYQRSQAGIPTLHLFGQRDQLDYFSESDEEFLTFGSSETNANVLTQSRTNNIVGGMSAMRRAARRKAAILSPIPSANVNSCDILGSILDSQTKLHSKHSVISVSRDGTIHIENDRLTKKVDNENNNDIIIRSDNTTNELINNPPLDLTSRNYNEIETTQAPMFPGRGGGNNRQSYGFNRAGYRGNDNRYDNNSGGGGYNNFHGGGGHRGRSTGAYGFGHNQRDNFSGGGGGGSGGGGGGYMNFHQHGTPPPPLFRGRGGIRFPMRRPHFDQQQQQQQQQQHHNQQQQQQQQQQSPPVGMNQFNEDEPIDLVVDEQIDASTSQEPEEDIDIYSDIEDSNVQIHDEEDIQMKSPPFDQHHQQQQQQQQPVQGLVSQAYNNSDDDDSGSELIIDDTKDADKYDPTQPSADTDSNSISSAVSPKNVEKFLIEPKLGSPLEQVQNLCISENIVTEITTTPTVSFSQQVVNQVVQEVLKEHLSTPSKSNIQYNDDDDDDEISNEDCPNSSIYSTTSIDIAKSTDVLANIPTDKPQDTSDLIQQQITFNQEQVTVEEETDEREGKDKDTENNDNERKDNDEWPSGDDEWNTCDAENAQKSWDQPYDEQSPVPSSSVSSEQVPVKETSQVNELEKSDEHEHELIVPIIIENKIFDTTTTNDVKIEKENIETIDLEVKTNETITEKENTTILLLEKDDSDCENSENLPKCDVVSNNFLESEQNLITESLTPPLLSSTIETSLEKQSSSFPIKIAFNPTSKKIQKPQTIEKKATVFQLYDDSDYEEWELKNIEKPSKFDDKEIAVVEAVELEKMTEAISEEERSYTPCLDEKDSTKVVHYSDEEKNVGSGIDGMDTEMISDEERNDFDESHDMKTISDGDALEINAKESELELVRADDYEEGEIIEKSGSKKSQSQEKQIEKSVMKQNLSEDDDKKKRVAKKKTDKSKELLEKDKLKENESKGGKKSEFKKISKNTKERNYRDKEKSKSKERGGKGKENKENNRREDAKKKKERKRDLERYNVRSIIAEKPKKDKFGRDIKSASRSSRSVSRSRRSRSNSWNRAKKRKRRSRSVRRSRSRSRSRSYTSVRSRSRARSLRRSRSYRRSKSPLRRSRSRSFNNRRSRTPPRNKRHFSLSRERERIRYRNRSRRRSLERTQRKKKNNRSASRTRLQTRTPSPSKHRNIRNEWTRQQSDGVRRHSYTREWTPSWSRSPTPPRQAPRHNLPQSMSPSWTPPLAIDKAPVQGGENLTVILNNNTVNKSKKKDKRKKIDKKSRDEYRKRKRIDRTPPPSKEVFASGDNILVSVSFNKTNEENTVQREIMGLKRKRDSVSDSSKKKKEKNLEKKKKRAKSPRTKKKNKEIANLKPVAIIDLDRSPFKELTPSPKDIIVLSDSDNCEKDDEEAMMVHHHEMLQEELMSLGGVQIQEDSAPQSPNNNYLNSTGPKTPPEPQIKFLLTSKQSQLRAINNPLHDPNDEGDQEIDPQEELEHRLDDILHKGPNTPPEPPSSPPSSPDAYDPFDPTKSRSPTPEVIAQSQPVTNTPGDTKESDGDLVDLAVGPLESSQKSNGSSSLLINDSGGEKQVSSFDRTKRLSLSPERTLQTCTSPIIAGGSEQTSESINIIDNNNKNNSDSAAEKTTKSPSNDRNPIGVIINQQVQLPAVVKPIIPTSSVITSTPAVSNVTLPRTNLFSTSTAVGGTPRIATSVPQRIILPTPAKASPAKMSPLKTSPTKSTPIKSTPIKPMPSKTMISKLPVPNMKPLTTPIRKGVPPKQPVNSRSSVGQNGNEIIDVDLDFDSPYSPGSSDYEDLFEPPAETSAKVNNNRQKNTKSPAKQNAFDTLFGSSPVFRTNKTKQKTNAAKVPVKMNKKSANTKSGTKTVGVKIDEDNLKILDDLPNSAVEMQVKDKFLKKLNRQERVVEEVKLVLKPHYNKKHVTKEQYKDILRKAVPKICHNRSGEINPKKIQNLIEAYVKKARHARRGTTTTNQGANVTGAQQPKPAKTTFWS